LTKQIGAPPAYWGLAVEAGRDEQAAADHPGLRKVWVDGGYRKHFIEYNQSHIQG
jgi:hypothetical protein